MEQSGTELAPLSDVSNKRTHTKSGDGPTVAKKVSLRMSFEDYKRMSNMLVMYMRRREEDEELSTGRRNITRTLFYCALQ